jgi:hypothetical protein
MHLVDKYMYFIYTSLKKSLIFDEMHDIKTPQSFDRGVNQKTIQPKNHPVVNPEHLRKVIL